MWTAKWILDAYKNGNEDLRWEMYMAYRDLRHHFDELEAGSGHREITVPDKPRKVRWNPCARLIKGKVPV